VPKNFPQVVLVSGNKFHAYHLARGLHRAGWLRRFITTIYDKHETGLPPRLVQQIPLPAYFTLAVMQLPLPEAQMWSYYLGDNWFDHAASRYAHEADVYHVFNHHGLHGMRIAKQRNAITIVERSAAHPLVQQRLLVEEYARYGVRYPLANKHINDKQLQEYVEADYIFVASDFVKRTMIAEGVPEIKMRKNFLGFSPEHFYPGEKRDDVFRVIFVGAISLQKGVQHLLEGFKRAGLPPTRSELLLIGETFPDASSFLPKYDGIYRHQRFVPHSELVKLYHSGSVFVLPSLQDGFGMVVYEAAACGLPVVITENVGATVRDGQDGFVIPICDPDSIAAKLRYLFEHEDERRRMGESARVYVNQFTWARYQDQVIQRYREILKIS